MRGGHFFKQTIRTVPLSGSTVLLRTDFNVPLAADGTIEDDFRIRASLPTIRTLLDDGCKVVIISHLGRPKDKEQALSLEGVAARLAVLLKQPVRFVDQTVGDKVRMAVKQAPKQSVTVLENLRFDPREEENDKTFASELAKSSGARYFVQDGFGVVHRAHASTDAITHFLPSVAGLLIEREYDEITGALNHPKRPLVAVLGGAKVSDKIGVIKSFVEKADRIVITGAMANTFLANQGLAMGKSKFEPGQEATIKGIYDAAKEKAGNDVDTFLVLPTDLAVGDRFDASARRKVIPTDGVKADDAVMDIGDKSIEHMVDVVSGAGTVVWNGTIGMAEFPEFAHGSARLALTLATHPSIASIIGGGDTADFVLHWDSKKGGSFTHVSTGGGASLDLMAGKKLPGIECLLDAPRQVRYTNKKEA